jgi:hypothetical protein
VKLLLAILLCFPTVCLAWGDWSREDKNWFIASNVAIMADWATTRNMTRRYSEDYWERNPLLGRQPSTNRVDLHFVGFMIGNYFVADYFQGKNRRLYLQIVTGVETVAVINNLSIGLKLEF